MTQLWLFFFFFKFAISYLPPALWQLGERVALNGGIAMQIVTFDSPPGRFHPPLMIMPCVVCLFRLKVISFVAFSALLCLLLHKANCSVRLWDWEGQRGEKEGEEEQSNQGLMAFSGWGTTQIYYNTKLMCTPSA